VRSARTNRKNRDCIHKLGFVHLKEEKKQQKNTDPYLRNQIRTACIHIKNNSELGFANRWKKKEKWGENSLAA
jgi:hypothetical protein